MQSTDAQRPQQKRTVVLVDGNGHPLREESWERAHTEGLLHRAFSVYVFREGGRELLVQQRSATKELWPLVWANTCCSHPLLNESCKDAGMRRLQEELGIACPLREVASLVYRAQDPQARGVEHEYLTLLIGTVPPNTMPVPNAAEVHAWKWMTATELTHDMHLHPLAYAPWFHLGWAALLEATSGMFTH